jgi:hypothetical protein
MAIVGWMGDDDDGITFQVSRDMVYTVSDWKWSGSARWGTHERHLTHALTEFTGMDPDQMQFKLQLTAELGVNPMDELVKLWKYEREGIPVAVTIGEHCYGKYRWSILSHSTEMEYTDASGNLYSVTVTVKLQEYLRG